MKKILVIFCFFILATSWVLANLMVSPQEVIFDNDDRERTKSIKLIHRGDKKTTYRVSLIHYKQLPNGAFEQTDVPAANEFFADDVVRISPRTVTLYPQEETSESEGKSSFQVIRIRKYLKSDSPIGEYRSHLLITPIAEVVPMDQEVSAPEGLSLNIKTLLGISIPLIIRNGNLEAKIKIQDIKLEKSEDGKTLLKFNLAREGNCSVRGDIRVKLAGKEIGAIKTLGVYLSNNIREVSLPLFLEMLKDESYPYQQLLGKTITIEFTQTKNNKEIFWANETYTIPSK